MSGIIYHHQEDVCDCGAVMDMFCTNHPDEGYYYYEWICQDDECGYREDRHEYYDNNSTENLTK